MIPTVAERETEKSNLPAGGSKKRIIEFELAPRDSPHSSGYYKQHSLAAAYWGDVGNSRAPLRSVAVADAEKTFIAGLLDMPTDKAERKPGDFVASVLLHILIIGAVLAAPLLFTQAIDLHNFELTYLTMPTLPAAPPSPPPPMAQSAPQVAKRGPVRPGVLMAPTTIPRTISMVKEEAPPSIDSGGVVGGLPGGEAGGVLGGLLGGTGRAGMLAPPPPMAPAQKLVYRVGGQVKRPQQIVRVDPRYPLIARNSHVEGIVTIDAVIDENGNVTQARAVSGPALLFPSALEAVMQWKFESTTLNGIAVPLELQVEVTFRLLSD